VGIASIRVEGNTLIFALTDGTEQRVDGLGIWFEMYSPSGDRLDRRFVPIGGTLKMQQYYDKPKK